MKPMKVGDLVALSSYGENLEALYRYSDFYRARYRDDKIPLHGVIVKVDESWGIQRYYIKWMKSHAPEGRDGYYGIAFFLRKDLKYVSRA